MEIKKDMMVYKNKEEKKPQIINLKNYSNAEMFESKFILEAHTGTHMDAPLHAIKDGKTILDIPLEKFISNQCKVLDFSKLNIECIDEKILRTKDIKKNDFLLFKTKNSFDKEFNFNFVYLNEEASNYLKSKEISGVGIDALGIERNQKNHETHKILLSLDIPIIEGLCLKNIEEKYYTLIALPLKINAEASLTRAVLVENL
ncbi:MAG: cyclase family protein [Peptostreptococcaceae bacterium]|jgi:arylformamidase|nr:cyclase family protein [Peptostreptococcaceae bacterium]